MAWSALPHKAGGSLRGSGTWRLAGHYDYHALLLIGWKGEQAMKLTYDPRHNIAYIRFREKGTEVESIRISDELVVDIAPDGTVYGIELLNANEQLRHGNLGKLSVINEATGEQVELPLAVG
jgi:uncharacterized protein YuzE